ncbi:MAG TPA: YceD family protein [Bacilli bacterium]
MKWSLQQLHKYNGKPFSFSEKLNFDEEIAGISDILGISEVEVTGVGRNVYEDDFEFDLNIKATLTLQDARTLEPVLYPLDIQVTEVFSPDPEHTDAYFVEKNTIDLRPLVWECILLEKPMRVVKEEITDN